MTEEDEKAFQLVMKAFGDNLKDFLIVVFTHKNRIEQQSMTVDGFVETIAISSILRKLINDSEGRYAAIGYGGQKKDREKEIKQILSMVDKIRQTGKTYCSDELSEGVKRLSDETERPINKVEDIKNKTVIKRRENLLERNIISIIFVTVGKWIVMIYNMLPRGIRLLTSLIEILFDN